MVRWTGLVIRLKKPILAGIVVVAVLSSFLLGAAAVQYQFTKTITVPPLPGHVVFVSSPVHIQDVNVNWTLNQVNVLLVDNGTIPVSGHLVLQGANSTATIFTLVQPYSVTPILSQTVSFIPSVAMVTVPALFVSFEA